MAVAPSADPLAVVLHDYSEALEALTFNSKPVITNLTIIAGEIAKAHGPAAAASVAAAIEARILNVRSRRSRPRVAAPSPPAQSPQDFKLPALYLLDSVAKNLRQPYAPLLERNAADIFFAVRAAAAPPQQASLERLRGTWASVFPAACAAIERRSQAAAAAAAAAAAPAGWQAGVPSGPPFSGAPPVGWPQQPGWPGPQAPPAFQAPHYGGMMYASMPHAPPPQHAPYPGQIMMGGGGGAADMYGAGGGGQFSYSQPGAPHPGMPFGLAQPSSYDVSQGGYAAHFPSGLAPPGQFPSGLGPPLPPYGQPMPPPPPPWLAPGPPGGPSAPAAPSLASLLQNLAAGIAAGPPAARTEFSAEALKTPVASIVASMYSDQPMQCMSSGRRFRDAAAYSTHLDLQYLSKRRDKEGRATQSRRYFLPFDAWVSGAAAVGADADAAGAFFDAQAAAAGAAAAAAAAATAASVPADESQPACALTGEAFETFWHAESEEWRYRGAARLERPHGGVPAGKLVLLKAVQPPATLTLGGGGAGEAESRAAAHELAVAVEAAAAEPELPPPHEAGAGVRDAPAAEAEAAEGEEAEAAGPSEADLDQAAKRIKVEHPSE